MNDKKKDNLLIRFKQFVKKNRIRIKAGVAATIVAGEIGIISWKLNEDSSEHNLEDESINQTHEHEFTEWTPYSELIESRKCECGTTQIQTHEFNITKTYNTSEGDTHIVYKIIKCESCGFEQTTTEEENCNYVTDHFDDEYEYKVCRNCGKEKKIKISETDEVEDTTNNINRENQYIKVRNDSKDLPKVYQKTI